MEQRAEGAEARCDQESVVTEWILWMAALAISGACGFWAGHVVGEMKSQGRAEQMLLRAMAERRRQKWEQNVRRLERNRRGR